MVNDGSTDGTAAICKRWANLYRNLVYIEQENQGQGTARNVAIAHASGKWLVFLDADDTMLPGALKYLESIADEDYDIVVYGCVFISRDQKTSWVQLPPSTDDKNVIMKELMSVLWDKMIRTLFWRNEGIYLSNVYGEDVCPVYVMEAQAENIRILPIPLMCHFDREDNLSARPEQICQIVGTLSNTIKVFQERELFEKYKIPLLFMVLNHHKHYYRMWRWEHQYAQKLITDELEELSKQYFPEEYQCLFEAEKETLVIIGKIERPFPAELEARDIFYYQCMEQYLLNEYKASNTVCHFIINVENEIQSVINGIRTKDWALNYWKMQCAEFLEIRNARKLEGNIFLYSPKQHPNEIQESFEKMAQSLWNCQRLEVLEDFWKQIRNHNLEQISECKESSLINQFDYRGEYLRLDYNVRTLCVWLRLRQHNVKLEKYFTEHGYKNIGIYGMGYLGERLVDELKDSSVKISFLIDQNQMQQTEYPIYSPEDVLPAVDNIVVTVLHHYDEIRVHMKCACIVVSLEEVVDWCRSHEQ